MLNDLFPSQYCCRWKMRQIPVRFAKKSSQSGFENRIFFHSQKKQHKPENTTWLLHTIFIAAASVLLIFESITLCCLF